MQVATVGSEAQIFAVYVRLAAVGKAWSNVLYYKLNENFLLRGWQKLPYAVVDKNRRQPVFITAREMQALQLCNGLINVDLPLVSQETRDLLAEIEKRGFITRCEQGDAIAPGQDYKLFPALYIRTAT